MTEPKWHLLCALNALPEGGRVGKFAGGKPILLLRLGDEVFAYEDKCPHAGAPLSDGKVQQGRITCRHHQWQFEIRTGICLRAPGKRLTAYPVKIEDGNVYVSMGS